MNAAKAGLAYFALVFAAGFLIGAIRILVLVPRLGTTASLLFELPVMLLVSWVCCSWCLRRFAVSDRLVIRFEMGAIAFLLLMAAEFAMWIALFARPAAGFLTSFATVDGLLGLAGQIAFAAMPLVRRRSGNLST